MLNDSKKVSGVYVIENTATGDCYIGSSAMCSVRFSQHRTLLRRGTHHARHLQNAWNKYGEATFQFEVLEQCHQDELLIKEQEYLTAFAAYNTAPVAGTRRGVPQSPETIERVRQSLIGKTRTPEQRQRMSAGMTGVPHLTARGKATHSFSPETREKMRQAKIGKPSKRLGMKHTDESKEKNRIAHIGNTNASGKRTPEQVERIRQGQLDRRRICS